MTTHPQHARAKNRKPRRRLFQVNRCPECWRWFWTFPGLRFHWMREH